MKTTINQPKFKNYNNYNAEHEYKNYTKTNTR